MCVFVCMNNQKQRQERLQVIVDLWKTNLQNGCSEVLNRKLCEDYMKQVFFLGHQTRQDYLDVVSSREYTIENE